MMAASLPLKHAARAPRPARGPLVLLACVCAAVLLCAALHPPALAAAGRGSAALTRLPAADAAAAGSRRASFVIAIATVHRPGGNSSQYLPATLQSLSCALSTPPPPFAQEPDATSANDSTGAASAEDDPPLVLVVNTEMPASRNTAFAALEAAAGGGTPAGGLQLATLALGELHPELHSPAFVRTLTARMSQDTLLRSLEGPETARLLAGLSETDRDPADRLWWRAKEALDCAYVLEAAAARVLQEDASSSPRSSHVLFLQDDVRLAAGFLQTVRRFLDSPQDAGVDVLTLFSTGGHAAATLAPRRIADPSSDEHFGLVAVVLRPALIPALVAHLRAGYADAPVEWLLNSFIRQRGLSTWVLHPNVVQHVGRQSSLAGKTQLLRSASFTDTRC